MHEPADPTLRDKFVVELTTSQRSLLVTGTWLWFDGPNHGDSRLRAAMMGLEDGQLVSAELRRISASLEGYEPLTKGDWARALAATELGFATRIYGSSTDWENVTGADDVETFRLLREVQDALADVLPQSFP